MDSNFSSIQSISWNLCWISSETLGIEDFFFSSFKSRVSNLFNINFVRKLNFSFNLYIKSFFTGTENSAAAVGVGALKSHTLSQSVQSVSCPIAEIIGIIDLDIDLAQ